MKGNDNWKVNRILFVIRNYITKYKRIEWDLEFEK